MPSDAPLESLRRLVWRLGLLLLAFVLLFGLQSWRSTQTDQVRELRSVLVLAERALDGFFMQVEADMQVLSRQLLQGPGLADRPRVQRLLDDFKARQTSASGVDLVALDGQILASSRPPQGASLPSLAGEAGFSDFVNAVGAGKGAEISRPLFDAVTKAWVFGLRRVMRDAAGQPVAVLSAEIPVDILKRFWGDAPVLDTASIGLLRDDGYLLSRHPVPAGVEPVQVYGRVRDGALRQHLVATGFPREGYVEGPNVLDAAAFGNVYRRLEHFPLTLFVAAPTAEFRAAWWQRVQVPFALVAAALVGGGLAYRYTRRRQQAWDAEREQAEAALVASEREQRFLIDHLMAGVVVHGSDGAVLRCNPQACELIGLTAAQMTGRALVDPGWHFVRDDGSVMPPDEFLVSRVLAGGRAVTGLVMGAVQPGRPEPRWLLTRADPERGDDGQLRQIVATFVDITELRRAERTRERMERRYRMLYENSLDAVIQGRPDGSVLSANPAACALLGRSEAEICAGGYAAFVDGADPRLRELLARRDREGHARGELALRRADGTRIEAEAATTLYADENGEALASMLVRDVTDRRRAAIALAAQQLAERANRAKSEFVARMSHELRTPLNAVLGFAEMMSLDERAPLAPLQRQRLEHVRRAGMRLLALINELLDLTRMEAGTPGLGSRLRIELPLAEAAVDAAPAPLPGDAALAGRVLYIDDDEVNRLLMEAFLGELPGVRLSLAAGGQEGLARARQEPPDLALVDMMMPGMDGRQVLQALRDDPLLAPTPCVAVSANAMPQDIADALAAGFDDYLTKPLSAAALVDLLQRQLGPRPASGPAAAMPRLRPPT